jgi:hypothetical protein
VHGLQRCAVCVEDVDDGRLLLLGSHAWFLLSLPAFGRAFPCLGASLFGCRPGAGFPLCCLGFGVSFALSGARLTHGVPSPEREQTPHSHGHSRHGTSPASLLVITGTKAPSQQSPRLT